MGGVRRGTATQIPRDPGQPPQPRPDAISSRSSGAKIHEDSGAKTLDDTHNLHAAGISVNRSGTIERLLQDFQLYGNGPQFAGFMLQIRAGDPLLLGDSIYRDLISPVPALGRAGRSESGTALYNRAIYGSQEVRDQIPLATIESYWNGGIPAVLIFGLLLGTASGWLDRVYLRSDRAVPRFAAAYFGYWTGLAVIASYEVISQVLIYFSAPFLLLAVLHRLQAPAVERADTGESTQPAREVHEPLLG
jgi:hypothetical protein